MNDAERSCLGSANQCWTVLKSAGLGKLVASCWSDFTCELENVHLQLFCSS